MGETVREAGLEGLWRICLPYATGGIVCDAGGIVREYAPIFDWMYGKPITLIQGWVAKKNGTIERVTNDMWQGNQQGGGGNEFVFLTGLFGSKSGKSITGSVKRDSFNTLFKLMQEADSKGVDLVFVVSGPGEKAQNSNMKGRLSVVIGRPQQERQQQAASGPFGGAPQPSSVPFSGPVTQPGPSAQTQTAPFGGNVGQQATQPPKDDLESFLEGFK